MHLLFHSCLCNPDHCFKAHSLLQTAVTSLLVLLALSVADCIRSAAPPEANCLPSRLLLPSGALSDPVAVACTPRCDLHARTNDVSLCSVWRHFQHPPSTSFFSATCMPVIQICDISTACMQQPSMMEQFAAMIVWVMQAPHDHMASI